ncbi:MAG: hypothetical protein ACO1Q7_06130 [Gemmatimonas sp.]
MLLIAGTWTGALLSKDGGAETSFSFTQAGAELADIAPAVTVAGSETSLRLLEGAPNVVVGLADSVPDPNSGCRAQVLLDMRVRGDRLVGRWLRRDENGVMVSEGDLVAERTAAA